MKVKKKLRSLSGGQAVVKYIKTEKVRNIFGLIGSATMEIFDSLYDSTDINFIDVRDERTGTHIADGYARASGQAGIMIAGQNGPGATNLTTGIAQAYSAFSPVITIAGAVSNEHKGKDSFQEIDQQSLFEPITKKTFTIKKTNKIPSILNQSFKIALTPKCGPVHINLPRDILSKKERFKEFSKHNIKMNIKINEKIIKQSIDKILSTKKNVIIVGAGIKNNGNYKDVVKLAKLINTPIVSSAGHGDAIPFDEKLYMGQMGPRGNEIASKLVKEAETILALGTRLGFNSTFYSYENINKKAFIIQVDIDKKSLGRYFPIEIGICNDASKIAKILYEKILLKKEIKKINDWTKSAIHQRKIYIQKRDHEANLESQPIKPSGLFKILRDVMPNNSAVTLDAGTLCLQATDAINYYKPPCFFTPLDFGLVGFSFACGLGVKIARPDSPVISLMGDGGFGMTISELSTAVEHKINTITIVMNNGSWGAEKAYQRDFFKERYIGSDIKSPNFAKISELYGAKGFKVNRIAEFGDALKTSLNQDNPCVIDVSVDPNELYSFRRDSFQHKSVKKKKSKF